MGVRVWGGGGGCVGGGGGVELYFKCGGVACVNHFLNSLQ